VTIDASNLLRKLEPPVRPLSAPAPIGGVRVPLEEQGFGEMLALVASGAIHSDRPLEIADGADLTAPIDDDDLARLAAAADLAESRGARRAVMLLGGRGVVVDVADRRVSGELTADPSRQLMEIDAAVYVTTADETAPAGGTPIGPPGGGIVPPAVARQLEAARRELAGEHQHAERTAVARGPAGSNEED
jgi:hypothetical protein